MSGKPAFAQSVEPLKQQEWVVYAKPPFGGPKQVVEYLGRYTHRVAISNERLLSLEQGQVTFRWKDYRHEQRRKVMTLEVEEFIRRVLLHSLPPGFQRIRYYGLLANCHRAGKLELCRQLLAAPLADLLPHTAGLRLPVVLYVRNCPRCRVGTLLIIEVFLPCHGPLPITVDTS